MPDVKPRQKITNAKPRACQFLIESIVLSLMGGRVAGDSEYAGMANLDLNNGDCGFSYLLSGGGNLLWLLSRAQSCGARSH